MWWWCRVAAEKILGAGSSWASGAIVGPGRVVRSSLTDLVFGGGTVLDGLRHALEPSMDSVEFAKESNVDVVKKRAVASPGACVCVVCCVVFICLWKCVC